jgi:serine/threonine protein phosphatase PrpC
MNQSPSISLDVSVAMDTDIGRKRKQNQDAIGHMVPTDPDTLARLGQIFVLADGVGGLAGGDLASQYAVSTIIRNHRNVWPVPSPRPTT